MSHLDTSGYDDPYPGGRGGRGSSGYPPPGASARPPEPAEGDERSDDASFRYGDGRSDQPLYGLGERAVPVSRRGDTDRAGSPDRAPVESPPPFDHWGDPPAAPPLGPDTSTWSVPRWGGPDIPAPPVWTDRATSRWNAAPADTPAVEAPTPGGPTPGGGPDVAEPPRARRTRADRRREAERGEADEDLPETDRSPFADRAVAADPTGEPESGGSAQRTGKAGKKSRSGRNMPAAIGVGVAMAAVVVASLVVWRPAFLVVIVVAVAVAVWEMTRAVRSSGADPPLPPLLAGGALMAGLAWWGHADGLMFGLVVTIIAVMVWRLADGMAGYQRDVIAGGLIAVYVPFLGGFAAMLAVAPDGHHRVIAMVAGVVLSDTGGFIAGVFLGRHPMAPTVSPKKSWEGFAGSMVAAGTGSAVLLHYLFAVAVWQGILFGLAVAAVAVLGDLGESLLKRDLKIKDMSNLLPGHGGLMDRLDSILFAAPTAYLLLLVMAPVG